MGGTGGAGVWDRAEGVWDRSEGVCDRKVWAGVTGREAALTEADLTWLELELYRERGDWLEGL